MTVRLCAPFFIIPNDIFHFGRIWKQLCTQIHHLSFLEVHNCIIPIAEKLRSRFSQNRTHTDCVELEEIKGTG